MWNCCGATTALGNIQTNDDLGVAHSNNAFAGVTAAAGEVPAATGALTVEIIFDDEGVDGSAVAAAGGPTTLSPVVDSSDPTALTLPPPMHTYPPLAGSGIELQGLSPVGTPDSGVLSPTTVDKTQVVQVLAIARVQADKMMKYFDRVVGLNRIAKGVFDGIRERGIPEGGAAAQNYLIGFRHLGDTEHGPTELYSLQLPAFDLPQQVTVSRDRSDRVIKLSYQRLLNSDATVYRDAEYSNMSEMVRVQMTTRPEVTRNPVTGSPVPVIPGPVREPLYEFLINKLPESVWATEHTQHFAPAFFAYFSAFQQFKANGIKYSEAITAYMDSTITSEFRAAYQDSFKAYGELCSNLMQLITTVMPSGTPTSGASSILSPMGSPAPTPHYLSGR